MTGSPSRSTDEILRHSAAGDGATRVVTLDPRFQGLPDTAHGGTILALFDGLAGGTGARVVSGVYRRRVPLGVPLQFAIVRDSGVTHLRLSDGAVLLVDGSVAPSAGPGEEPAGVTPPAGSSPETSRGAMILPLSKTCFACGVDNTLGLHASLDIDDDSVGGVWTPRDKLRAEDGTLAGVAVTALLDEAAFWLGAAASGEAGMTTDLRVRLHAAVAFGRRIVVGGSRASVRAHADDDRYWDTDVAAWDDDGTLVASASITFVAVRGAARKLVAGLLAMNPPEVLRRVFPLYAR
jgi:acyl-coenzyme A thioesterase PaaI-like protein